MNSFVFSSSIILAPYIREQILHGCPTKRMTGLSLRGAFRLGDSTEQDYYSPNLAECMVDFENIYRKWGETSNP